ncbi:MAG: response regulator transcription factor [Spirulinaceae cyanobacterium SM2_1_0]|nr:response regulator transcription factor [Spirulinaceae cyanobacterium SM2_1_0]
MSSANLTAQSAVADTHSVAISVLLVDDCPQFRQGLRTLLGFYSDSAPQPFQIVGEAATREQALGLALEQHPQLILLDMELCQRSDDGINTLTQLKAQSYTGKSLVLSGHRDEQLIFRAMQAGALGYVLKDRLAAQLPEAIATVLDNQVYLAPEVATSFFRLFHFYAGRSLVTTSRTQSDIQLTEREQEVLNLLVEGKSNVQIAEQLYVTVATVKAHLTSIFEKLGVKSRTQTIVKALKLGLVDEGNY